jgi:two-component system, OmpR family, response regulator
MAREPLVLVVEDEFLIAFSTAEMLEDRGFAVVTAGSLADAMRVLDDLNERLAGLFLDVYFRDGTTSFEVARAARRRFPDIAVLYASGLSEIDFGDQFVPGSAFMAKPCNMDAVARILGEMTGKAGGERGGAASPPMAAHDLAPVPAGAPGAPPDIPHPARPGPGIGWPVHSQCQGSKG